MEEKGTIPVFHTLRSSLLRQLIGQKSFFFKFKFYFLLGSLQTFSSTNGGHVQCHGALMAGGAGPFFSHIGIPEAPVFFACCQFCLHDGFLASCGTECSHWFTLHRLLTTEWHFDMVHLTRHCHFSV
jgi:hypothetical protein